MFLLQRRRLLLMRVIARVMLRFRRLILLTGLLCVCIYSLFRAVLV